MRARSSLLFVAILAAACSSSGAGGNGSQDGSGSGGGAVGDDASASSSSGGGGGAGSVDGASPPVVLADGSASSSTEDGSCGAACTDDAAAATGAPDPAQPGPYGYAELDDTATIAATGDQNAIHCAYPTSGPTAGPYPVIVFAHGFEIAASEYYVYLQHLASFGYVALTADFPTSLLGNDNPTEAKDLAGALDWAAAKGGVLAGKVDVTNAGISGHSLGGKLALLTASTDARFKATITLDPVDGGGPSGCTAPSCVLVSSLLPSFTIPTAFLGETTDATSTSQACAPAADNFATLFGVTPSPSFAVTVAGANHMSFIEDTSACGLTCSFCNPATAAQATVLGMAQSYLVAFYERHLRGNAAYDAYLTGAVAQSRYVATLQATIQTK